MKTAIVGATGAVGQEILQLIEKQTVEVSALRCFASPRSVGKTLHVRGEELPLEALHVGCFAQCDYALFCAGGKISREWVPAALDAGAVVIDASSYFRMCDDVPLIIPEINAHALQPHHRLIASPNCSTSIMLMALAPLHRRARIKRIVVSTYQAASGAGFAAMQELQEETRAFLSNRSFERSVMPFSYAFNLFTHNSALNTCGYVEEELKLLYETRKILEDEEIQVSATCVRVPVLRAHSEAINVTFCEPLSAQECYSILEQSPGVCLLEDRALGRFAMPIDAMGQDLVYYSRIREDASFPNTLNLWVVGDQLLKGAALNVVQILQSLLQMDKTM
ncbi:MAG TPA: aspartate-semialdehyde dehydrogenase [Rhabdochlamydiaceae bacterium]|jgi:aspartate-semialdehyde dehydrogenase